ncbi:hypothetical protein G7Y89_g11109 [Cudoniella acicularis]|uniref:Heterokaryon incompatibility domain-containing protein n=1 Tax=Cudoniella acicularis TaxID=354080 RepID=A0A8H4RDR6_9HELO|nr:hypothetical protein G7Y89_g11109 [Cudoniella acicularis]
MPLAVKANLATFVLKQALLAEQYSVPDKVSIMLNHEFCEACRHIFDGAEEAAPVLNPEEAGPYFIHWSISELEESAKKRMWTFSNCFAWSFDIPSPAGSDPVSNQVEEVIALDPVVVTLENAKAYEWNQRNVQKPKNTGSTESLAQIHGWIKTCDEGHLNCLIRNKTMFMPTRLLDLESLLGQDRIALIESKDLENTASYCTLSHCWGKIEILKLMTNSLSDLKKSTPFSQLPLTFQEAIKLVRQLGQRYIWIDSLCIIQGSTADWEKEARTMWEVYSNSYFNISATASIDGSQGLFRDRNTSTTLPCISEVPGGHNFLQAGLYQLYDDRKWDTYVDRASVNTRGWRDEQASTKALARHNCGHRPRYWDAVVKSYTSGDLTKTSDKLIAVSGLARRVFNILPLSIQGVSSNTHPYVARLWLPYLVYQLIWSPSDTASITPTYNAPSWPWASINGLVAPHIRIAPQGLNNRGQELVPISLVLSTKVELLHRNDPFGPIRPGATLQLAAPLLKLRFESYASHKALCVRTDRWDDEHTPSIRDVSIEFMAPPKDRDDRFHKGSGRLDWDPSPGVQEGHDFIFLLTMAFHGFDGFSNKKDIVAVRGLLVTPSHTEARLSGNVKLFKRVGTVSFDGKIPALISRFSEERGDVLKMVEELVLNGVEGYEEDLPVRDFAFEGWEGLEATPAQIPRWIINLNLFQSRTACLSQAEYIYISTAEGNNDITERMFISQWIDKLIDRYPTGYVEVLASVSVQVVYLIFGLFVEWIRPSYVSGTSRKILVQSLRNHVVATMVHVAYVASREGESVLTRTFTQPYGLPLWREVVSDLVVVLLLRDMLFYVIYRLWHVPGVYERVHAKHHEARQSGDQVKLVYGDEAHEEHHVNMTVNYGVYGFMDTERKAEKMK